MPKAIAARLVSDFSLTPVIATEIEFYLHGASERYETDGVIAAITNGCVRADIPLAVAEAERGPDQYEVSLLPSADSEKAIADTERFKSLIAELFSKDSIRADFSAKPLADAPGNGLHVHLHLEDASGKNVFFREGDDFSPPLLHVIGGQLAFMNACMTIFAPYEESYARFTPGSNAPATVSWGTNNRTVAVRLPAKPIENKHIEHRVAGSDANIAQVVAAILAGAHYGVKHKCNPGPPIYGDASLGQYNLPRLARSLAEAKIIAQDEVRLKDYDLTN